MSKWKNALANADIDLTCHAQKNGYAKLEVMYYREENGWVRKEMIRHFDVREKFYDNGGGIED